MGRPLHRDLHILDVNIDLRDLEEVLVVALVGRLGGNLEAEAGAAHEDVADAGIFDGWETLLAVQPEAHVAEVQLYARDGKHDFVLVAVFDLLAAPAPVVVSAKFEDVWCEIVALDDEVLHDYINLWVRVLDTRDSVSPLVFKCFKLRKYHLRNVADVHKELGNDNFGEILDEMRLESGLAVLVVTQVDEQLLHSITKRLVLGISIKLVAEELELIEDTVGVPAILIPEEIVALIVKRVPIRGQQRASLRHD